MSDAYEKLACASRLAVLRAVAQEVELLEAAALKAVQLRPEFTILKTIKGVGPILGLTIMLETGDVHRFPSVGDYSSYCRQVKTERLSNGKKNGAGNTKAGNKYLSWAFAEAAHFCVRWVPVAKRFYERKRQKTNDIVAIRAIAHKLARASYYMLKDQTPFDANRLFA